MEAVIGIVAGLLGVFATTMFSLLGKWIANKSNIVKFKMGRVGVEIDLSSPKESASKIGAILGEPQVFISYSMEDKEIADSIAKILEEKGIRAWMPDREIKPGDRIARKINEGLETSGYFILLISKSYGKSKWLSKELEAALARERKGKWPKVIPILIDDVELPQNVHDRQYVNLMHDFKDGITQIVDAIRA